MRDIVSHLTRKGLMPILCAMRVLRSGNGAGSSRHAWCGLAAALILLCAVQPAAAGPGKHVLVVRAESPDLRSGRIAQDAIESIVRSSVASPVEFYAETIDTGRFAGAQYERRLTDLFNEKYSTRPLDLVVALGGPAVEFVVRQRALFPNTPLLLGMIERRSFAPAMLSRETGVVYLQINPIDTLKLAVRMQPGVRKALVVGGSSRTDRGWMQFVREDLSTFHGRLDIDYDSDSSIEGLARKAQTLPSDTVILYTSITRDGEGAASRAVVALERLHATSAVPIFGLSSRDLGHGIVGGHLVDLDRHGADLGRQAVRMLAGERPAPITTPARAAVDWRELQRHGIDASMVPASVGVEFREPTRWERQKGTILLSSFIVAIETALIVAFVLNGYRRRQMQRRLEIRLRFERLLSEISVALAATPPAGVDAALDTAMPRIAATLGIECVWRWDGSDPRDVAWRSMRLMAGDPEWFSDIAALPPSIRARLRDTSGPCSVLSVPLVAGDVAAGALFGVFGDPAATWGERGGELHILAAVVATVLQRKQVEIALEGSDRLKGAILDSLPAHVAVVDRDGIIIAVNGTWSALGNVHALPPGASIEPGVNFLDVFGSASMLNRGGGRDAIILIEQACRGERTGRQVEFRFAVGQTERWFLMTAEPLRRAEGGAVVTHWEITERKLNEIALRESEDRFRRLSDALPVSVWMSDADGECIYLNKQWLQVTGRQVSEQLGDGWLESIHPDDRPTMLDLYLRAFHVRESFRQEFRLRCHDGTFRWMLASGTPRYGSDGAFHGFVGGSFDITEQKQAEQLLRDLSHRLMRAQDDERRRIARELHDHLSQQLALLAVDLQQLAIRKMPARDMEAALQESWRRTTEIASDVHGISHRLHPSKMEALGLVATAQGHCRDISRQSLPVHFSHADVPAGIPADSALSVFRILEEALSNVLRHSGATEARVALLGTGTHIVLRVADNGRGFIETGRKPSGIGLVSMRERLQLLEGTLSLTSVPAKGTVLEARIPLARAIEAAPAAPGEPSPRVAPGDAPAISA